MYADALKSQGRVVLALMLHEATRRYGGSRIGYLWALIEPLAHVVILVTIRKSLSGHVPVGSSMVVFVGTGILPFFLFANVSKRVDSSLDANDALLSYPIVKPPDVILGRALLEGATLLLIMVLFFGALQGLGDEALPSDPLQVVAALAMLFIFGVGLGVVEAIITAFLPSWSYISSVLTRMLYWFSGVFYLPTSLPPGAVDYIRWNPIAQCVDWVRVGFYPRYTSYILNREYVCLTAFGLILVAFAAERVARARLSKL